MKRYLFILPICFLLSCASGNENILNNMHEITAEISNVSIGGVQDKTLAGDQIRDIFLRIKSPRHVYHTILYLNEKAGDKPAGYEADAVRTGICRLADFDTPEAVQLLADLLDKPLSKTNRQFLGQVITERGKSLLPSLAKKRMDRYNYIYEHSQWNKDVNAYIYDPVFLEELMELIRKGETYKSSTEQGCKDILKQ